MTRYHFKNIQTLLGLSYHSSSLRGYSSSCDTISFPWHFPIIMVIRQGKSASITLPSGMTSRSIGGIPSTLLTTEISHIGIAPILKTIYIIISTPIPLIVASLLAVTLASATAYTVKSTIEYTTTPTIWSILLGIINIGLVTRMQVIWRVVLSTTIITWDFLFGHAVPMARWNVTIIGNI